MAGVKIKIILLSLLFLSSCLGPSLHKDRFFVLGTYLEVLSEDKSAAGIVYQEFRRLDSIFNKYSSDSEIYKLNNNPGREIKVSPELIDLILKSKKYYQLTDRAFDVSKGKLYSFWKEWGENGKDFPAQEKITRLNDLGSMAGIKVDVKQNTVKLKEGVSLDFSGVAKGYIVDKAAEKIKKRGINSALINAGGDIYCLGDNRGKPWRVGVSDPLGKTVKVEEISAQAVVTSGNYRQFYQKEGKIYSHIIDPRTGYPVKRGLLGVTVIADQAWVADILATAFFINGKEFAARFIKDNPSVKAYFVTENELVVFQNK